MHRLIHRPKVYLLRVAVPAATRQLFDYLPAPSSLPAVGARVRVPLGHRRVVGVITAHVDVPDSETANRRYKVIASTLDDVPLLPPDLLAVCRWCAAYYQHPLGQVIATALPVRLRRGMPAYCTQNVRYAVTAQGRQALTMLPARNVAQRALLERLAAGPATPTELGDSARGALATGRARAWVEVTDQPVPLAPASTQQPVCVPTLTGEQEAALSAIESLPEGYSAVLLDGVTGSGKTELYLRLARRAVNAGYQVLALAPEIGLTPQLVARFQQRFGDRVASYHSGMGEAARLRTWLAARAGDADIIVGTRSAIFVPLARPGLIVVDEEHDSSYKQQDGLRYSARDLAVLRAHRHGIPIVLGSATPSLESLHNVARGRYTHAQLRHRINTRPLPSITLMDIRGQALDAGLSEGLLDAARCHLEANGQVLFFINRRGFAPVLLCHECGWSAPCPRCDAHLSLHRNSRRLVCHHCGYSDSPPSACPNCGHAPLSAIGQGTERIEAALQRHFPGERIERFDSDRTRSAAALKQLFDAVHSGAVRILVGTQILAKGHDFAGLTLAGLVDVDSALYGSDFRAVEHMAQLVIQVAGRVGRGPTTGEVILQTRVPEHPQLQSLAHGSYACIANSLLAERRIHGLPPYTHLALLRSEARRREQAMDFLRHAVKLLGTATGIDLLGPTTALMERRADRYRAQLLIRASSRHRLQVFLDDRLPRVEKLRSPGGVRWSIDVDPCNLD